MHWPPPDWQTSTLLIAWANCCSPPIALPKRTSLLTSGELGVPLGHILIQTGVVAPDIVGIALTTQRQIRMKIMTVDEAVERLRGMKVAAAAS
jgi:hypothetical protein